MCTIYWEIKTGMTEFLIRNHRGQKEVKNSSRLLKEKNSQPTILYPEKIPFRNEGEMKGWILRRRNTEEAWLPAALL